MLNGVDRLALTKLDVLDDFPTIKVCTAYELDGKRLESMPLATVDYGRLKPIYQEFPGWRQPTTEARSWNDLPAACQNYLRALSDFLESPLYIISVGPRRDQTFYA